MSKRNVNAFSSSPLARTAEFEQWRQWRGSSRKSLDKRSSVPTINEDSDHQQCFDFSTICISTISTICVPVFLPFVFFHLLMVKALPPPGLWFFLLLEDDWLLSFHICCCSWYWWYWWWWWRWRWFLQQIEPSSGLGGHIPVSMSATIATNRDFYSTQYNMYLCIYTCIYV